MKLTKKELKVIYDCINSKYNDALWFIDKINITELLKKILTLSK